MRLPLILVVLGLLGGCARPPQTGTGFYLPPGDAQRGKVAFVQSNCHACHTVVGVPDLPKPDPAAVRVVQLGGEVSRVRSYGDLVTSIIYPSHSVSDVLTRTPRKEGEKIVMPEIAAGMSVSQLVDLVTFLQPQYKQHVPTNYGYGYPDVP